MAEPYEVAYDNLSRLAHNPYPGRGIIVGKNEKGQFVQVYWIMGRSQNSRNRIFVKSENGDLRTEAADPNKVKDPSLIIYRAMAKVRGLYVVSNGAQTDAIIEQMYQSGFSFHETLLEWEYEPDPPNYTPRISAIILVNDMPDAEMSIIRRSPHDMTCQRHLYSFDNLWPGYGYCLTTYSGDGDPLPSFQGEPFLVPIIGGIKEITERYWAALNPKNRVALAVKMIDRDCKSQIHIINRFTAV